jgi:hypothetical protein
MLPDTERGFAAVHTRAESGAPGESTQGDERTLPKARGPYLTITQFVAALGLHSPKTAPFAGLFRPTSADEPVAEPDPDKSG